MDRRPAYGQRVAAPYREGDGLGGGQHVAGEPAPDGREGDLRKQAERVSGHGEHAAVPPQSERPMTNSALGPGIATMANAVTVNAGTLCSTATDVAATSTRASSPPPLGLLSEPSNGTEREATVKP
ncbi:hypothetical protein AB0F45_37525 [Streptomyces achromogenes]|uniref:hypothetical protein n=1 Tax=Streptomyces achromogenes TaxID=67255 RepID=UPI00340AFDAA